MPVTAGIIQGGIGAVKLIGSMIGGGKAKREARKLEKSRPVKSMSQQVVKNLAFAESDLAQGGFGAAAESAYNDASDRSMAAAIGASNKSGAYTNIGEIYDSSEEGAQRLAMMSEQLRVAKIQQLAKARGDMAEEERALFEFNQWMPWADKAQANAEARKAASAGKDAGLGMLMAGAATVAKAGGGDDSGGEDYTLSRPEFVAAQPTTSRPQSSLTYGSVQHKLLNNGICNKLYW
jgi:hypothetical protein